MAFIYYLFFYLLALLATLFLFFIASYAGTFIVKSYNTINHSFLKRRLSVYGYQCFYLGLDSMEKDINCQRLLPILREVYTRDSNFNPYCSRLSEERLPFHVFMNWTRSVAEDLFYTQIPSIKVDQWNHYWQSKLYTRMTFFHIDFPEYEEHEFGCLWGGIYFWLAVCFEKDINDDLLRRIAQLACKAKPAFPYFHHFYNATRNMCGSGYFIPFTPGFDADSMERSTFSVERKRDCITATEVYDGFEQLSVNERCRARQLMNDVLFECPAWKEMCREMKNRGWFKETIYAFAGNTTVVNGDYVVDKHVNNEVNGVASGGTGVNLTKDNEIA